MTETTETAGLDKSNFRALIPAALATCVNIIALGVMIPLLPFYVKSHGGGDFQAALVFSTYSACSLLSAPLWGRLSDKIGRKPVLMISVAATIVSYLWLAHAGSMMEIFISRAFAGLTAGWLATSQAFVSDVTTSEDRAKGMGMLGAAFGIGFTIGPLIVWRTVGFDTPDFVTPAYLSAGFAGCGLLITAFLLKEPVRHKMAAGRLARSVGFVAQDKLLAMQFLPYFLVSVVFTGVEGTFAQWSEHVLSLGPAEVGYFLGFAGIVNAFVQGGLVGRMSRRFGEVMTALTGAVCLLAGSVCLALTTSTTTLYLALGLISVAMGLHNPAMQSLMSKTAPDNWKGGVLGAAQSSASLARIIGPALAGLLLANIAVTAQFWACAALAIPTLYMIWRIRSHVT
ncbi:MAG: MFS transporter [Alphaproteobacteria bacterium]